MDVRQRPRFNGYECRPSAHCKPEHPCGDHEQDTRVDVLERPQYQERLAGCLATGHSPVIWDFAGSKRVLCTACGNTFPSYWLRLVTMAGVAPIGDR